MDKKIQICLFFASCSLWFYATASQNLRDVDREKMGENFSEKLILEAYADDLTQTAARYENGKGKTRGVPLSLLYDAAKTFTIAYDMRDKSWLHIFLKTHPKVEKGAFFAAGASAMYGALWFKRFMHL